MLQRSFRKHGIKRHKFEIIVQFDEYNKKLLYDLESHYIRLHSCFADWKKPNKGRGLNLTEGGHIGTQASITKIKNNKRDQSKRNWWYKPTDAHKEAIRNGILGIKRVQDDAYWERVKGKSKPIYQFNRNGELLMVCDYVSQYEVFGFKNASIYKCCSGQSFSYKGFFFSYDKNFKPDFSKWSKQAIWAFECNERKQQAA